MHTARFIGGLFAIFIVLAISYFTEIEFINVIAMSAFVLAVDSLIVRYIAKIYMKVLIQNTTPEEKDKE